MENTKNRKLVVVLIILGVVMLFTGLSYAIANFVFQGQRENKIEISGLSFTYKENTALELTKLEPLSDENGMASGNTYTFGVTATSKVPKDVYYYIYFTIDGSNTLLNKYVTFNLTNLTTTETSGNLKMSSLSALGNDNYYAYGSKLTLTSANLTTTNNYRLTIWVNSDYASDRKYEVKDKEQTVTVGGDTFKFKINVKASDTDFTPPKTLNQSILGDGNSNVLSATATLTDTYSNAGDASGLYKSVDGETDSGTTYFYRGDVTNNYVSFAGFTWRIVRINENGSVRLFLNEGINNNTAYAFNYNTLYDTPTAYMNMYYSNSDFEGGIKRTVDTWYNDNLKKYENYIVNTDFCEAYKATWGWPGMEAGNETVVNYNNYVSNFKCSTDKNGKGILTSKVGLLTYDEAVHAGSHPNYSAVSYITDYNSWLMSPSGVGYNYVSNAAAVWSSYEGSLYDTAVASSSNSEHGFGCYAYPVISLKAGLPVTGSGTSDDPYVIQMS